MLIPPIVLPILGYSLFSGLWWVIQRRLLTAGVPKSIILFASGAATVVLIIASILLYGLPAFSWALVGFVLANILLNIIVAYCYASAVAKGEASLAVSVTAFAPVLAIFTGYLFFGEAQPAETTMAWDPQATQALELAVKQAPVPAMLRGKLKKEMRTSAEATAKAAGRATVTPEDLLSGLMAKLPPHLQAKAQQMMADKLKSQGK